MAIFLIRHGQTVANATRVIQLPDAPLSDDGVMQADRLAARLVDLGVALILSSDFIRALTTAARIAAATGVPVTHDAGLQERSFGDLRGTPYADLEEDPFGPEYEPPGGESWDAFHWRVTQAWDRVRRVAQQTHGNLAVVTHGLVCYSLAARHLALPEGGEAPMRWANTALTIVDSEPPWTVRLLNCTAHLDGLNEPAAVDSAEI